MATGSGNSIGSALIALAADLGGAPRKASYTAKGWHAQISKLTSTKAGYEAADAVGLDVTERTLKAWLAESVEPNAKNRALIHQAYERVGGRWPGWERMTFRIYGVCQTGSDRRDRGAKGTAALRVDGTDASGQTWAHFQSEWEAGGMDEEDVGEEFADMVGDAIGDSDRWTFPGPSYTVTAS